MTSLNGMLQWRTLGEVARWGSGGTPKRTDPRYFGGSIPWVVIGDLNDGTVLRASTFITEAGLANSSAKWVEPGAVLVAMYGSIGKLGMAGRRLTTNQAIAFAHPLPGLSTNYLFWFLRSIRRSLVAAGKGGTQQNISQTILKEIPIPLPSLGEQAEIVGEIESNFSRLDSALQSIAKSRTALATYRDAVLTRAFADARDPRPLVELCEIFVDCEHRTPIYGSGDVPALRPRDVVGGRLNLATAGKVSEAEYQRQTARHISQGGDVVYSRELSYGWAVEIPDGVRLCLGQGMVVFRLKPGVLSRWVTLFLNGPDGRRQSKAAAIGTAHPHINLGDIKRYQIPIAPLDRQRRIIDGVERQLSINELGTELDTAVRRADSLKESILMDAFPRIRR